MDDTHPENDVRVERQRWSEACDSMVESGPPTLDYTESGKWLAQELKMT
jgi:hypothetical protein